MPENTELRESKVKLADPENPTCEELKEIIAKDLDPDHQWLDGTDDNAGSALILLSMFNVGFDEKAIQEFTKLPVEFVRQVFERMRQNKILEGDTVRIEWMTDDFDVLAMPFWLDVMVCSGKIARGEWDTACTWKVNDEKPVTVSKGEDRKQKWDRMFQLLCLWDSPRDHDWMSKEDVAELKSLRAELRY